MSYCIEHRGCATQNAMAGRCLECELTALRECVEKTERERDEAQRAVRAWAAKLNPLEHALEAAREDIKALATVIIADNAGADWPVWATERIRARKLLEVSDGE